MSDNVISIEDYKKKKAPDKEVQEKPKLAFNDFANLMKQADKARW